MCNTYLAGVDTCWSRGFSRWGRHLLE